jgi:hypothetical protein
MERRGRTVYCRFADDECEGPQCTYAICIRNRMLPNNLCGLTIKKDKKTEELPLETVQGFKVKGKLSHRLGEEELY